jgi:hypothetical protein
MKRTDDDARAAMRYLVLYGDDIQSAEPAQLTRAIATVRRWLSTIEKQQYQQRQLALFNEENDNESV